MTEIHCLVCLGVENQPGDHAKTGGLACIAELAKRIETLEAFVSLTDDEAERAGYTSASAPDVPSDSAPSEL